MLTNRPIVMARRIIIMIHISRLNTGCMMIRSTNKQIEIFVRPETRGNIS